MYAYMYVCVCMCVCVCVYVWRWVGVQGCGCYTRAAVTHLCAQALIEALAEVVAVAQELGPFVLLVAYRKRLDRRTALQDSKITPAPYTGHRVGKRSGG